MTKPTVSRSTLWILAWILPLTAFWRAGEALVKLSLQDERYTQLLLIPFVTGFLIFLDRERIFEEIQWAPRLGIPLLAFALTITLIARPWSSWTNRNDQLWLPALAIVLVWASAFLLMNGPKAARVAIFPLCFLLLMIPIPSIFLDRAVYALQKGSTELTDVLFRILGIPVFRRGFILFASGNRHRGCEGVQWDTVEPGAFNYRAARVSPLFAINREKTVLRSADHPSGHRQECHPDRHSFRPRRLCRSRVVGQPAPSSRRGAVRIAWTRDSAPVPAMVAAV